MRQSANFSIVLRRKERDKKKKRVEGEGSFSRRNPDALNTNVKEGFHPPPGK